MISFNNVILGNIYKNCLENKNLEIKRFKKIKYIPVVNTFWMVKNDFLSFFGYNISTFAHSLVFALLIFLLSTNQDQKEFQLFVYLFMTAFFGLWLISFFSSISKNEEQIEMLNDDRLKEPLSKEDFKTILSNFNMEIIEKVMKENNGKFCYSDLETLDHLLLNQKEVLSLIKKDRVLSIWRAIDDEDVLGRFDGKSEEEIIEALNNMGLSVKNKEQIIVTRDFYRSLKEESKKENVL